MADSDGDFLGDDTTCDDNPCYVPPTGACCRGETCIADRTQAQCDAVGGGWNEGEACDASTCIETPCDGDFNDDDGKGFPELLIRIVAVSKSKPELLSTAVSKVKIHQQ